mmetsp:Transcript_6496/g.24408  ORF Transcript_6496/g.24408 Transcript_6496/m.24408 type:complete len:504 (-) Transcript_6496:1905-3416(-)
MTLPPFTNDIVRQEPFPQPPRKKRSYPPHSALPIHIVVFHVLIFLPLSSIDELFLNASHSYQVALFNAFSSLSWFLSREKLCFRGFIAQFLSERAAHFSSTELLASAKGMARHKSGYPQFFHDMFHVRINSGHVKLSVEADLLILREKPQPHFHSRFYERLWHHLKMGEHNSRMGLLTTDRISHPFVKFVNIYKRLLDLVYDDQNHNSALDEMRSDMIARTDLTLLHLGLKNDNRLIKLINWKMHSKNRSLLIAGIRHDILLVEEAHPDLANDRDFIKDVLTMNGGALPYVGEHFMKDPELAIIAHKGCSALPFHPSLMIQKDFLTHVLESGILNYEWVINFKMEIDHDTRMAAVRGNPESLQHFRESPLDDQYLKLVRLAVKGDATCFQHAKDELKSDRDFIESCFFFPDAADMMPWVSLDLRDDAEFMYRLLNYPRGFFAFHYMSDDLKCNKHYALKCVQREFKAVELFHEDVQSDPDVIHVLTGILSADFPEECHMRGNC